MKIDGTIKPIRNNVIVSDMEFGMERTRGGLLVPSSDGKTQGIVPRWGKVWAVGPEQKDVKVGEWILVEHGRWTRTIKLDIDEENSVDLRMVDNDAIIAVSDEKPNDVQRAE
jgi:co-chaperonin GroES (HSP10)